MRLLTPLRGRNAFRSVLRSGRVFDGRYLRIVYVLHKKRTTAVCLGLVVPKRYAAGVLRNRAKRLIREAWHISLRPHVEALEEAHFQLLAVTLVRQAMPEPGLLALPPLCSDVEEFVGRVLLNRHAK